MAAELVVEVSLAMAALLNAVVILPVYYHMTRSERQSMVKFQLHPEATRTDFQILLGAVILFLLAIIFLNIGIIFNKPGIEAIGDLLSLISSVAPVPVFIRWWRRFR